MSKRTKDHYRVDAPVLTRKLLLRGRLCERALGEPRAENEIETTAARVSGVNLQHMPFVVNRASRLRVHRGVQQLACYFRREFRYDFPLYRAGEPDRNPRDRAYLWVGDYLRSDISEPVVGACCFRWRTDVQPNGFALQFAWFHPYARRKGRLSSAWPFFRARFGDFVIEEPLSYAMRAFVSKHDTRPPE
jgi:hypothetical protein